jgi:hypothetical protein
MTSTADSVMTDEQVPKLNINLKKLNLVVNWEFNSPAKECSLCRNLLMSPSPQELSGTKSKVTVDGNIIVGECKHMFHKDCMDLFIKNGSTICPIDKTPWKTMKVIRGGVVYGNFNQLAIKTKS